MEVLTSTKTDLKALSRNELVSLARKTAQDERRANALLVRILREVSRRQLYLEMGYTNLYAFVHEELGYEGGSASRRVGAAQAAMDLPDLDQKIESGAVSLSSAARLNQFLKDEKHYGNGALKRAEKREVLKAIENRSEREAQGILAEESTKPKETNRCEEKALSRSTHLLQFEVDQAFYQELEEVKLLLSHCVPSMKTIEAFRYLMRDVLKKKGAMGHLYKDPQRTKKTVDTNANASTSTNTSATTPTPHAAVPKTQAKESTPERRQELAEIKEKNFRKTTARTRNISNPTARTSSAPKAQPTQPLLGQAFTANPGSLNPKNPTRYIKTKDKHALQTTQKDGCTYQDPQTGRRCCSRYQLQADHKIPFSKGGPTELENLQWLCARHNIAKGDKAG